MQIALGMTPDDDPDDSIYAVPQVARLPVVTGPVTQQRLEDLQLFAFLTAVAVRGASHPISVGSPETDPPDRMLLHEERSWGLELTELTLEDLRTNLGRIRSAATELQSALDRSTLHDHLRGKHVTALITAPDDLPNDPSDAVVAALEALEVDRGSWADVALDPTGGMPSQLPAGAFGSYGTVGPFTLDVNSFPGLPIDRVTVSTETHASVSRKEALAALESRIRRKDRPSNDLLLVTCGLPDKTGSVTSIDAWIFKLLVESARARPDAIADAPKHIRSVVVHDFSTGELFEAYRSPRSELPWPDLSRSPS